MRGRVGKGLGRRFVALALAEILCFQSLMGTGVAQALAPTVDDVATAGQTEAPAPQDEEPVDWTQRGDAVSVTAGDLPQQVPATLPLTVTVSEQVGEGDTLDLALPEGFSLDAEALVADGEASHGGSGAALFTGDATSSAMACLMLAGCLALVGSGLRRRRRRG